jgi:hypothetical protein
MFIRYFDSLNLTPGKVFSKAAKPVSNHPHPFNRNGDEYEKKARKN